VIPALGWGALTIALLSLCGWGLARLTWGRNRDTLSRLAASVGAGVSGLSCCWLLSAIHPALLWAALLLLVLLSLGTLLLQLIRTSRRKPGDPPRPGLTWAPLVHLSWLGLLAWRMYQVRGLAFPAWVDSVHHAVIVRKMREIWQLPTDLSPYLQMPFFYHFAFHGVASLFAGITHLSLPQSIIVVGQALQVAAGLSVYCLGRVMWRKRRWAAVAAALACLVAQMPTYYTAWGKYPLLTAMVLLPLAMAATLQIIRDGGPPRAMAALAILVAGATLAHSFAALLLLLFIGVCLAQALPSLIAGRPGADRARGLLLVMSGTALGLLAIWPWIRHLWMHTGRFVRLEMDSAALTPDAGRFPGYLEYLWELTGPTRNRLLFALALPGIGLAVRRPTLRPVALWLLALLPLASPWGPRLSPFGPDRVLILLFLPASLLATEVLRALAGRLARWHLPGIGCGRATAVVTLAVAAWAAAGGIQTRDLVPPSAILALEADAKAMDWIETHVPEEARFFIELAPWPPYGYRGVDGGWWLLPMTGRQALLPPALHGLGDSQQVEQVNRMARRASDIAGCGPRFWDLVLEEGLSHVYFNLRRASLRPPAFDGCPATRRIYAQDGVYIYQLLWPVLD